MRLGSVEAVVAIAGSAAMPPELSEISGETLALASAVRHEGREDFDERGQSHGHEDSLREGPHPSDAMSGLGGRALPKHPVQRCRSSICWRA